MSGDKPHSLYRDYPQHCSTHCSLHCSAPRKPATPSIGRQEQPLRGAPLHLELRHGAKTWAASGSKLGYKNQLAGLHYTSVLLVDSELYLWGDIKIICQLHCVCVIARADVSLQHRGHDCSRGRAPSERWQSGRLRRS